MFSLVSFRSCFGGSVLPTGILLLRLRETVGSVSDLNVLALFPWGSLRLWRQSLAGERVHGEATFSRRLAQY